MLFYRKTLKVVKNYQKIVDNYQKPGYSDFGQGGLRRGKLVRLAKTYERGVITEVLRGRLGRAPGNTHWHRVAVVEMF